MRVSALGLFFLLGGCKLSSLICSPSSLSLPSLLSHTHALSPPLHTHTLLQVSMPLVDAYLARRALDYLVGFHLSPVLWRRLPGARSAGRVQSVALRLVSEREDEIEMFTPREYWSVDVVLAGPDGQVRKGGEGFEFEFQSHHLFNFLQPLSL
jgi:hypothetical protein